MFLIPALAADVAAQDADVANAPKPADPGVAVSHFDFNYGLTLPDLPPLDELKSLTIKSTHDGNVFRAPAESGAEDLNLNSLPEGSRFDGGALLGITQAVVRWCAAHGLNDVWVAYTDLEPSATGVVDNRPADNHAAQLLIWVTQKKDETAASVPAQEAAETHSPAAVAAVVAEVANTSPPASETVAPAKDEAAPVQAATPLSEHTATPAEAAVSAQGGVPQPSAEPAPTTTAPESVKSAQESVTVARQDTPVPAPVQESVQPATEPAPPAGPKPVEAGVAVNHFEFSYGLPHPDLPPLEQLNQLTVKSTRDGNVYRAPTAGGAENLTLSGVPAGSRFDGGALRGIAQEVVHWYNSHGLYGVWVAYNDLENSPAGVVDNRTADNQTAHMVIWASQITEVRTLARGKRIKTQFSINNPKHRRIISQSPLHPGATKDEPGSLFRKDVLDDYLYGLSLHPGRRVEASIASAGQPGKVVLDYLVNESKPWQIFSQVNNYGTAQTGQYRARLGFQHNQLTNHDDILNVDLISTPDFKTYGSFVSYRIPVLRPARLLFRIYGSYGDFVASDTTSVVELRYVGKNWLGGMELTNRLTLWRDWQLLSALGFNFNHYGIQQVINNNPLVTGSSNFLVPFIGTTLSRNYPWGSVSGGLRFDHTVGSFANLDTRTGIPALGRRGAEPDWTSARWNLNGTVYLEPLFSRTAKALTLAHEFSLRLKGRVLLRGKRMIPHEQEPLGGALSIRGYPESILSADEFVAATVEYAYHVPRDLKPAEEGTLFHHPFRWRPKQVGQNPDWDLVLRAFYDYAYRGVNPAAPLPGQPPTAEKDLPYIDKNFSISGYGVGVALMVKQNFSLRCDYGVALTELRDDTRLAGEEVILAKGNKQVYLVSSFSW